MIQQIIALTVILYFILRLIDQKKKNNLSQAEFLLWLVFWSISIIIVVFIRKIDILVAFLGFSSAGINVILYLAIAFMFYLLFRIRIKIEKMDNDITKLTRSISLNKKDKN